MSKYDLWWDSLDTQTKQYLKKQPLWHDKDLYKALAIGILIGLAVGFVWGYDVASPDYSKQPVTYVRG